MKINDIINEGISSVIYHFTSFRGASRIIETNRFNLRRNEKRGLEHSKHEYYMSTTRHRLGAYHAEDVSSGVLFTLDGRKLSNVYAGKAVEYGSTADRPINPVDRESEDRVYASDKFIPNASKYIMVIELVLMPEEQRSYEQQVDAIADIYKFSKSNNIPFYVYTNERDFLAGNKAKAVSIQDLFNIKETDKTLAS